MDNPFNNLEEALWAIVVITAVLAGVLGFIVGAAVYG